MQVSSLEHQNRVFSFMPGLENSFVSTVAIPEAQVAGPGKQLLRFENIVAGVNDS